MKVLVAYMSKTGNTKKIAEAMYEEIGDDKEMKRIEDVDTIEGYDIAFLGFPIHQQGPDKKAANLLAKHCINGRKVVLFITHGAREDGEDLQPMLDKFKTAACGANIVDMFNCQGELNKTVKLIMSAWPNAQIRMWAKMDTSQGQPDESRIERARAFSRDVMNRVHGIEYAAKTRSGNRPMTAAVA